MAGAQVGLEPAGFDDLAGDALAGALPVLIGVAKDASAPSQARQTAVRGLPGRRRG